MCDSALRKHTKRDLNTVKERETEGRQRGEQAAEQLNGWLGCGGGNGREEVKRSHCVPFGKMFYKQLPNIDGILLPASQQIT